MKQLDMIILFFSCIFEIYIYYNFFDAYLDVTRNSQSLGKRIILGALAAISLFIINTYGNTYINILGFIVIVWTYSMAIFQANIGTRILYFSVIFFVGAGCEFLFGILLNVPLYISEKYSFVSLSDIPWHMFTMKLLTYVLFSILKQFFGSSKKTIDDKIFIYYLCIPTASIAIMIVTYYSGVGASAEWIIKLLLSISFALMLFANIFVFNAFHHYSEEIYKNTEQKRIILRQAIDLQYYEQVQKMNSQYQHFVHDITHHLKAIGQLAKENKNSNIISIVQDLNIELENSVLTIYCSNSVVNAILSEKKSIAEKNNLDLDIYVEPGITFMEIAYADIIIMLSNLLDNALRAAKNAENKSIVFRMYLENEGCFYIIKIENHFIGSLISTDIGFISTKKEKGIHGVGIKSVKNTAEKYNGYLEFFVKDNLFTTVLVLSTL